MSAQLSDRLTLHNLECVLQRRRWSESADLCTERNWNVHWICYGIAIESELRFCDRRNSYDVRDVHAFKHDNLFSYEHRRDFCWDEQRRFFRYRRDVREFASSIDYLHDYRDVHAGRDRFTVRDAQYRR
jgi:hypothetical protein